MSRPNDYQGLISKTEQGVLNNSVDPDFDVVAVENLEYDPQGNLVRKKNNPTDGYCLANVDVSGDPIYIGYLDTTGAWYIRRISLSAKTVVYVKGSASYPTAWADRASQSYDTFDAIWSA